MRRFEKSGFQGSFTIRYRKIDNSEQKALSVVHQFPQHFLFSNFHLCFYNLTITCFAFVNDILGSGAG